jgi:hypothetical protein
VLRLLAGRSNRSTAEDVRTGLAILDEAWEGADTHYTS